MNKSNKKTSNKSKKIIKVFLMSFFLLFVLNISFSLAADKMYYTPEVTFPGFDERVEVTPLLLGEYISSLYQYLLYVAGVVAVIVVMIAGFQWITAGGNQSKIGEAKERLTSAIIGLFLALTSYLLLYTINPNLVEIVDLSMPSISPISSYCGEGQMVKEQNSTGGYNIKGKEAECGKNYDYQIDGNNYQCEGIYCASSKICYEKMCSSPYDACSKAGREEFYSGYSVWTGVDKKVKDGWDGEIELYLPEDIKGVCYKFYLFNSGLAVALNWSPEQVYYWGWAYDEEVSTKINQIANGSKNCSDMNLKITAEYLACRKSSQCKFSVSSATSANKCVNAN